jgi:hypothetical protein
MRLYGIQKGLKEVVARNKGAIGEAPISLLVYIRQFQFWPIYNGILYCTLYTNKRIIFWPTMPIFCWYSFIRTLSNHYHYR